MARKNGYRVSTPQSWTVGSTVRVGFVSGLHVHEKVASPGNYRPDGYLLSRGEQIYSFVPHRGGLAKHPTMDEAREAIRA